MLASKTQFGSDVRVIFGKRGNDLPALCTLPAPLLVLDVPLGGCEVVVGFKW